MLVKYELPIYHVYNRGAHKVDIFRDRFDYERMLKLFYIANNDEPFVMQKLPENVFEVERKRPLVRIISYCLMPNHIHIALKPTIKYGEIGITKFMQKLATGYTCYFNVKYDHSGTIWQGSYKQKTVHDERYARILIDYIHLNPFSIEVPLMTKDARREQAERAATYSSKYEYSSLKEYLGIRRAQSVIVEV